jgi:hypothetical protein
MTRTSRHVKEENKNLRRFKTMKKSTKIISLSLSGLMVIGLLLSMAVGTMAAPETLTGMLETGITTEWTVNGEPVDVDSDGVLPDTVCINVTPCSNLAAGMLVTVVKDDTTNIASTITVLGGAANSTVTGVVATFTPSLLTLADTSSYMIGSYTTLPGFLVLTGDTVNVTFKPSVDPAILGNFAIEIEIVNSTAPHTFEGTITALANGNTTWTVEDDQGKAYDFTVSADLWPLVFGVGDRVAITFTIVNGDFIASAVQVLETAVPVKTESERCTNDKSNHPALTKLAARILASLPEDSGYASVKELQADLVDYFCKGFGVGEIRLAFKYSAGSEYSAQMLLSMRAQGSGWGELKKLAKANPVIEESNTDEPAAFQDKQGKSNKPEKELKSGRSDKPGKSGQRGKPDKPGKSGKRGKP